MDAHDRISSLNLWYDEAISASVIQEAVSLRKFYGFNPPLYYFLLRFWYLLLGNSEMALRSFSVLCSLITIIITYKIAILFFDVKTGILSAFLLSVSPLHVYYAREIRTYSLLLMFAVLSIYYFLKLNYKESTGNWLICLLFTAAAAYTHFSGFFLIAVYTAYIVFSHKETIIKLYRRILSPLILLVVFYPILYNLLVIYRNETRARFDYWIPALSLRGFVYLFSIFNLGYHVTREMYFISFLLIMPVFISGIWKLRKQKKNRFILYWIFIPIITLALISLTIFRGFVYRNLIIMLPAYYMLIAFAVSKVKNFRQYKYYGVMALLLLFFLYSYKHMYSDILKIPHHIAHHGEHERHATKESLNFLEKNFRESDVIAYVSRAAALPAFYYARDSRLKKNMYYIGPYGTPGIKRVKHLADVGVLGGGMIEGRVKEADEAVYEADRVWLIMADWETGWSFDILHPEKIKIKEYFDIKYDLELNRKFKGIKIFMYIL